MPRTKHARSSGHSFADTFRNSKQAKYIRYKSKPVYSQRRTGKYSYKGFGTKGSRPDQNRIYQTLTTVNTAAIVNPVGFAGDAMMNLNSAFNPLNNFTGQPLGWDQLTPGLYDRYKVWSGKWTVKFVPGKIASAAGEDGIMVFWVARSKTVPATLREALSQPGAKSRYYSLRFTTTESTTVEPIIMSGSWNLRDWFPDIKSPYNTYNASPSDASNEVLYLNYFFCRLTGVQHVESTDIGTCVLTCVQQTELVRRVTDQIQVS